MAAVETTATLHVLEHPEDVSVALLTSNRYSVQIDEDTHIVGPKDVLLPMFETIVEELRAAQ